MTTFALVHGAWGSGWHWAEVPGRLRALGHEVVAPDLPCEEPDATFDDYAEVVLDELSATQGGDVVVVGFSLGGHTAARVAARRPVREVVYVAAMIPEPGLSLNDQFARRDRMVLPDYMAGVAGPDERGTSHWVDFGVYWQTACHDCPEDVARERFERSRGQSTGPYREPWRPDSEAALPARYVLCTEDRLMDNSFWRRAVPRCLGVEPIELGASHSPMASRPAELVELLAANSG